MTKNCIVSLATKNGVYVDRLSRLSESLRDNLTDGDFIGFIHEASVGAPPHLENPYAFKIYAIRKCVEAGYTNILWLDTSMFAIKNVQPIFDEINANGYLLHNSFNLLSTWCIDSTLSYFGIERGKLNGFTMATGGFMGFNFDNKQGTGLFNEWEQAMKMGLFKGGWANYRHDMAVISCILFNRREYIMQEPDTFLQYAGLYDQVANESIIFKARG